MNKNYGTKIVLKIYVKKKLQLLDYNFTTSQHFLAGQVFHQYFHYMHCNLLYALTTVV